MFSLKVGFHSLEVSANNQDFTLILGSVRTGANKVFPLGVVGIKGLYDTDTMYTLKQASIKGLQFPFNKGSIAEALNEARRESAEGLKAAHQIASALRSSSNLKTKREANLVYAVTNLAMHLNANTGSTKSTLSALLDKLNFMSKGRNIFDFISKAQKGDADALVLNDFKGLSDLQNYFAGTANDTMVAALQRSIEALDTVEVTAKDMLLTDELMKLEWSGSYASFQRKDLYMLKSVFIF